jgi:hypothetical protein
MSAWTDADKEKLDSIEYGATQCRCPLIKLAYAVEKSTQGSGESGDAGGDSTKFTGTAAFTEIAQCLVLQPAFRNSGILEFSISAEFENPPRIGSGKETVTFELSAGLDYPANNGLPPTFATVATFTTQPLATGAGLGTIVFLLRILAEGHKGDEYSQALAGQMFQKNLKTLATEFTPFTDRIHVDPTEDIVFRWRFRISDAPVPGQKVNVTSLGASLSLPSDLHAH